jgi:putative copper export protein
MSHLPVTLATALLHGLQDEDHGASSPTDVAVRWLTFAALLSAVGSAGFERFVLRRLEKNHSDITGRFVADTRARTASLGFATAGVLVGAVIGRLGTQILDMGDTPVPMGVLVLDTGWGHGWLVELSAAILAVVGFQLARSQRTVGTRSVKDIGWPVATLAAAMLVIAPALSGHAISDEHHPALAVTADALHVLGAAGWMGMLLCVVLAALPAARRLGSDAHSPFAALVTLFSDRALACGALLVASGTISAWLHLGSFSALWRSAYGVTLLVKLSLLIPLALLGAYNWRVVRPRLASADGVTTLRRSATAELAIAAFVIAATAVLVGVATPR